MVKSTGTRRRGAALERAILDAAAAELRESGFSGLTMDRVAARAATNKNAIYRRWPNRAALGLAAYRDVIAEEPRLPDTGELRGDALELLRDATRLLTSPHGALLRGLLAGAAQEPTLASQVQADFLDDGTRVWLTVLGRAVARGEAAPQALRPRVATAAMALLRNEFATRGAAAVTEAVLADIVDEVYLPLVWAHGHGKQNAPGDTEGG
jgi:AcrR family transcriptional regulator